MKHYGNVPNTQILSLPIDGNGSDIPNGALIGPGVTAGTNMGVFALAAASGLDAVGIKHGLHDFSEVGDSTPESAADFVKGSIIALLPGHWVEIEYDLTSVITATGASTTSTTATSLEDNIDGSWLYYVSGDAIGQLAYVTASASADATHEAITTAPAAGDTFIKIMGLGKKLLTMNSARTKMASTAAVGTWTATVIKNQIRYTGSKGWEDLEPGTHHNLQGLNGKNVEFRAIVSPHNLYLGQ